MYGTAVFGYCLCMGVTHVTQIEEHANRLRVLEKRTLRGIFGPKIERELEDEDKYVVTKSTNMDKRGV